ncbi:Ig-like domain-containing protein [Algoriphagus namhaensis]|uniref:Ig-like domain-containing protein n=1 Tax=Algoriphagus namhaensis TaxID=915353 RepID=A0ABV8APX2_9BACT
MKKSQYIALILPMIILWSCAKQSTPTGGPRDETPPKVLAQYPENQSLNVNPKEIWIEFDEYIKLDNPNKNIIITPRLNKDEVITTALKNKVTVELNQELEPNTTYVFNFQKSIQDLSEGNPAEQLKIVFSTGPTIDSLVVTGRTNFLFPDRQTVYDDVLVGLYEANDTTDVFTAPPYYIAQVDSLGQFKLENLRSGAYLAYAWLDANNSLKAEFKTEEFAFISDTLIIDPQSEKILHFNLAKADQTAFKLTRSSTTGSSYQLVFNKGLREIEIIPDDKNQQILHKVEKDRVKLYRESPTTDSLLIQVKAKDSIQQSLDTLIWAKFEASDRRKDELNVTVASGKSFYQELKMELTFTKPVTQISFDSLFVSYDTASIFPIAPSMLYWRDSAKLDQLDILMNIPDSLSFNIFTLIASDSTFRDIEGEYNSKLIKANFRKLQREGLADEIAGTIQTDHPSLIVQLLTAKDELVKELILENENAFSFTLIEPGTYKIKVIEDDNQNGEWDPGDFSLKRQAEKVYYFQDPETNEQTIMIRGGWSINTLQINSVPNTGILKN